MQWVRGSFAVLAAITAGCGQLAGRDLGPGPGAAEAAPVAQPVADLASYSGRPYADFVATHQDRFAPEALGLAALDSGRLQHAMAASSGALLQGGGAEAMVFRGCATNGCGEGVAVVAIDPATGGAFVGVRDAAGKHVLAPNERLEALLRLNAPTRDWVDAGPPHPAPEEPPVNAARP
ncbi:MAG TPA: hypothetical protein VFO00_13690 [Vitreimonas sp.]|nr:hypothetical protein [Vitreimonas sp.]